MLEQAIAKQNELLQRNNELLKDLTALLAAIYSDPPTEADISETSAAPEVPAADVPHPAETEPVTEEPAPETTKAPALDDVRKALMELSKVKGRDAARAMVESFGAAKVGELKADDYAAVIENAQAGCAE